MSFLSSIFGKTQDTTTTSNQTGKQSYGLSGDVNDYWKSISNQFTQPWNNVGPNSWQLNSANNTAGYASGLNPSFGAASSIGQNGISTSDINKFMNPYTDLVINATLARTAQADAMANAGSNGQAAKLGALGGTNTAVSRALAEGQQKLARDATVSGLYNQGYQSAADMAAKSTQAQLAGVGAAGNIAGLQSSINNTGFGQGSQLWGQSWQNALMPYQIAQQGAGTLAGLAGVSGNNTSGTATGTSNVTSTPSWWQAGTGVLGMGMQGLGALGSMFPSMFPSDERVKENIKPVGKLNDGQTIYKFNYKGDPRTQIGLMAQEVEGHKPHAVGEVSGLKMVDYDEATKDAERGRKMSDGGSVGRPPAQDPMDKFARAYESISGMLQRSRGGGIGSSSGMRPRYDAGGWVNPDTGMGYNQSTGLYNAPAQQGTDWGKIGQAGKDIQKQGEDSGGGGQPSDGGIGAQQAALGSMLAGMSRRAGGGSVERRGYDEGGSVWGENGPTNWTRSDDAGSRSGLGGSRDSGPLVPDKVERGVLPPPPELRTIRSPGGASFSVAPAYADQFGGLLDDLRMAGYPVRGDQSGGYAHRFIAGTDKPSEHAYGRAIDVNWDTNARGGRGDLPPEMARALALKHGLKSGYDFPTPDAMHFEVNKSGEQKLPDLALLNPDGSNARSAGTVSGLGAAPAVAGASYRAPETAPAPDKRGIWQRVVDAATGGMMANKPANAWDKFSLALMGASGPDVAGGAAQNLLKLNEQRIDEERARQQLEQTMALAMGSVNGKPTLQGRQTALAEARSPADIAHLKAITEAGSVEGHQRIEDYKLKLAKDLASQEALRKTEASVDNAVMSRFISPEEGERRKQAARELYIRGRENIHESSKPPTPKSAPPPGATLPYVPGIGVTPPKPVEP